MVVGQSPSSPPSPSCRRHGSQRWVGRLEVVGHLWHLQQRLLVTGKYPRQQLQWSQMGDMTCILLSFVSDAPCRKDEDFKLVNMIVKYRTLSNRQGKAQDGQLLVADKNNTIKVNTYVCNELL